MTLDICDFKTCCSFTKVEVKDLIISLVALVNFTSSFSISIISGGTLDFTLYFPLGFTAAFEVD